MITSGKNPIAMAATVVYLAALENEEKISQAHVSKVANISSVTIRNLSKKIKDAKINRVQALYFRLVLFHNVTVLGVPDIICLPKF